jgi:hypothetical protein
MSTSKMMSFFKNPVSIGAHLSLQLDQKDQSINGGSKLTGTIYLDVEQDSISADSLNLKFCGHEATQVSLAETKNRGVQKEKDHRQANEQRDLVSEDYVVSSYNGRVNKGRYEYPFEITLPVNLPGKQGERIGSNWYVVEYFLEARLHRNGVLTWDVSDSKEIFLTNPQPCNSAKTPSFIEPISRPVHFCCLYKTGAMTLLANVNSIDVFSKDMLQVEYVVRNESSARIKALEISIKEVRRFKAKGQSHHKSSNIVLKRLDYSGLTVDASTESLRRSVSVLTLKVRDRVKVLG